MKRDYDLVFVTHLPAFYKVNLYRAIAKQCHVFVIFIAQSSEIRTADFTQSLADVDHLILDPGDFESRSQLKNCYRLWQCLRTIKTKKIVVGGWDLLEFWAVLLFSSKKHNALALESSYHDSVTTGWRKRLKQAFLSRVSLVLHSGQPHHQLVKTLGFQGATKSTMGVGMFRYSRLGSEILPKTFNGKFLYVGRLAPEKNIDLLLSAFRLMPQYQLTIVGTGPLTSHLQSRASENVQFLGHVSNDQLAAVYQEHAALILPSFKEPWGLVVEEALYHGLPVLASNRVGCAKDLIEAPKVGALFEPTQVRSLREGLDWINTHYESLQKRVGFLSFETRDKHQIAQYIESVL